MLSKKCPICKFNTVYYTDNTARCGHCTAFQKQLNLPERILTWTNGKAWWWRGIILLWIAWIAYRYMTDYSYPANRIANIFNAIDFGIHELGHFLFIFFGEFMAILGGSLLQVIFPIVWMFALAAKRWYFAASMCVVWVGLNLYDVAAYAADARERTLPLATLATDYDSAHDWYQILSRTNLLESDKAIAGGMRLAGAVLIITGLLLGLLLLILMITKPFNRAVNEADVSDDSSAPKKPDSSIYPAAPPSHSSEDFKTPHKSA